MKLLAHLSFRWGMAYVTYIIESLLFAYILNVIEFYSFTILKLEPLPKTQTFFFR